LAWLKRDTKDIVSITKQDTALDKWAKEMEAKENETQ
jgi:hypothetical protein